VPCGAANDVYVAVEVTVVGLPLEVVVYVVELVTRLETEGVPKLNPAHNPREVTVVSNEEVGPPVYGGAGV
jgi:hypothetical protein